MVILFTKWLSGRAARENIGPKVMKYGPSTARLVHYDQSNKLALYLQFYSCYSFALVLYEKCTHAQSDARNFFYVYCYERNQEFAREERIRWTCLHIVTLYGFRVIQCYQLSWESKLATVKS